MEIEIKYSYVFDYADVYSAYLSELLSNVLDQIIKTTGDEEISLGAVIEARTRAGYAGEVTEDNVIYLDSEQLKQYDNDVAMALVAHELAHSYCEHYKETYQIRIH
jgi:predicted metal-dependent hydrolase